MGNRQALLEEEEVENILVRTACKKEKTASQIISDLFNLTVLTIHYTSIVTF